MPDAAPNYLRNVPNSWTPRSLASLCAPDRPIVYGIVQAGEHVKDGVPYVRTIDLNGALRLSSMLRTTPEIAHQYRRASIRTGDLLFSLRGNIGDTHVTPSTLDGANISRGVARISVDNRYSARFVRFALYHPPVRRWIQRVANGSTFREITIEDLRKIRIPIPESREEQEAIASALRLWETAESRVVRLEKLKRRTMRGLMQQLLTGRRRRPAFADQRMKHDLIIGDVPADWDVVAIGDVTKRVTRRNSVVETHVLTASGQYGLVDQREFFNRSVAGADLSTYYLLKHGEFAYNRSRMKGYKYGAIKRLDRYPQGAISTLYLCFAIADKRVDSDFLRWYCEGGQMNHQLFRVTPVGGRAHGLLNLTSDDFFSIRIMLPSLPEQHAIADVLDTAQREIDLLKQLRDQIQQQKRGLMQKLLTGQIPVPKEARA